MNKNVDKTIFLVYNLKNKLEMEEIMFLKNIYINFKKYRFLLKQLVSRDFKVKYKRSVLGVVWSLLHPLLMMSVMALIFSNIFKFSMPGVNYLVYLMIGLTFFNYYNEASNGAMGAITSNSSLIGKVYIPKYIFPLSKCIFVGINFVLTLIPLYLVILFSGSEEVKCTITSLHLLLPYSFLCLFVFTIGMGFILSTIAVFFRDMFYIYSIITTIWMYFTPIMYDINMMDPALQMVLKCNPLFWFIEIARQIILYNQFPSSNAMLYAFISSVSVFVVGLLVFRKNQDRFIYYL